MVRLRGGQAARPAVDPGLAGGLRDWLEDGLVADIAALPADVLEVRVSKHDLTRVLTCEAQLVAQKAAPAPVTAEMALGCLVDAAFRQWVTIGVVADPLADGLEALAADGDGDRVSAFVAGLSAGERRGLDDQLRRHVEGIVRRWPVPHPAWMPRTQANLTVPLGGGRVVLSGIADLMLGAPASAVASVCVVEVKSGPRRVEHRADVHFYALLETLRSGAPPFRVATYYTATGELDVEPVGEDLLTATVPRVLEGTSRLCRLAAGQQPTRTPNPLCGWCPDLPGCEPGRRHVQRRAGGRASGVLERRPPQAAKAGVVR